ncbi:MAG: dihydrolipoamide acetyltransferase family protein [Planctomycetota bacterium]|jgi:pyruvate dehydrogenase E2 component (dihydrolipoamide acetyltransferase)
MADNKNQTIIKFLLPSLGEGTEEGTIVNILVNPGDHITEDMPVIEIETGKATLEVPSGTTGTVSTISINEGDTVKVGDLIAEIYSDSETSPSQPELDLSGTVIEEKPEIKAVPEEEEVVQKTGLVMATPSVRKLARELGINIKKVSGTGTGGRITEYDVKNTARELLQSGATAKTDILKGENEEFDQYGKISILKFNNIRKEIAGAMQRSSQTIPQVTNFKKVNFENIYLAKDELKKVYGTSISVTAILIKILAKALTVYPKFNAEIAGPPLKAILKKYINIGVAVDTEKGLTVPVIRNVDKKNAAAVYEELASSAEKAKTGKLTPDMLKGASFTISNLGGLSGEFFTPLVNPPQVAILGVGKAVYEPVVSGDEIKSEFICPLSLSYDHRLIDGADAARFLQWISGVLNNPLLMLMEKNGEV